MFNKYTIELNETKGDVRATIYLDKDSLGSVWVPNNTLKTKQDFVELFTSVGQVVYGQEEKAKRKEKSDSEILALIKAKNKAEQEALQKETQ